MLKAVATAVGKISAVLARPFAVSFVPQLQQSIFGTLLGLTDVQLRTLTKEAVDEVVRALDRCLRRVMTRVAAGELVEKFALDMALKRFR